MLTQLVKAGQHMGPGATFAALAEHLRAESADFDPLIADVAADSESELETARLELAGAIRQTRMKLLKAALDELAATGMQSDEARVRYRELMTQQEKLRREAVAEIAQRQ